MTSQVVRIGAEMLGWNETMPVPIGRAGRDRRCAGRRDLEVGVDQVGDAARPAAGARRRYGGTNDEREDVEHDDRQRPSRQA